MISNKVKLELCREHSQYLLLINILGCGNGMALQEQVINTAIELRLVKNKKAALKKLLELKKAELIKEQRFVNNSRFLILKKFAVTYLNTKLENKKIASVVIPRANYKYHKLTFKAEYFKNELLEYFQSQPSFSLVSIESYIGLRRCNYMLDDEIYMKYLYETLISSINKDEIEKDMELLRKRKEIQCKILKKEIDKAEFPKSDDYIISDLTNKNIIINTCILNRNENTFTVKLNYLDYKDKQDIEDIIHVYSIAYSIFRRLIKFNYNVYIDIKVCTSNMQSAINMKEKLLIEKNGKCGRYTKLDELLDKYNLLSGFITIQFENYDVKSRYLK